MRKNCKYNRYDKVKKRVICECKPKTILEELINFQIDKNKLLHKFIDFKSTTNFNVIFCYKTFFCFDGIISNIGSYILIIIFIISGICVIIFYTKGYKEIDDEIENLKLKLCKTENVNIFLKKNNHNINNNNKIKLKKNSNPRKKKRS